MSANLLQLCPHDSAPFGALCANYAQAAVAAGMEVTTVFLGAAAADPIPHAVYLDCDDLRRTRDLKKALRQQLAEKLAPDTWDIVLCHRYRALVAAMSVGLPAHKSVLLAHEYDMLEGVARKLYLRWRAAGVRLAGVSPSVAKPLAEFSGYNMVLPNVLDTEKEDREKLTKDAALVELGLSPGPFTIGVIGRLHYKKQPALAVEVLSSLRREVPDARLVFVGDGDEREALASEDDAICLAGHHDRASRLFDAFDVILHTGNVEAFGMVLLEGLFAGIPVVV